MLEKFCFVSPANLTAHEDEKVGLENFELLKVLGTGGKQCYLHRTNCTFLFCEPAIERRLPKCFLPYSIWKSFLGP